MSAENKELARRWIEELWNELRLELVDELHAEDYVRHHDSDGGRGREHYKAHIANVARLLPDGQCSIQHMIAEDDIVIMRIMITGTHQGAYGDIEPTGRPIAFQAFELLRFRDGQIVESWHSYDRLSILEQMGAAKSIQFSDAASS
jgi:steroid delta-isomerase-like uncharacterized protein